MKLCNLFSGINPEKDVIQYKIPLVGGPVTLATERVIAMDSPIPAGKPRNMVLQNTGAKRKTNFPNLFSSGQELLWVSRETDDAGIPRTTRTPREKNRIAHVALPFRIGKTCYPHIGMFLYRRQPGSPFFMDRYGRRIFHFCERFPCFDSYDYLYDHRRFHWFFLMDGNRLVRVYYADESNRLCITTDVAVIEEKCWEALKSSGFLAQ